MPLYLVSELIDRHDKNALLVREHFGNKYDNHYMQKTTDNLLDDDDGFEEEVVVIDEDAAGKRTTIQVLCITVGPLGVRPYPSACDAIIVGRDVFVAGQAEYDKCFLSSF
jgi:hypothetical protein